MGTKKGQRRKTSRRAYDTKSGKSLIKQTEKKAKDKIPDFARRWWLRGLYGGGGD